MSALRRRFGPLWLVIAAILVALLVVAGCGDDDDDGADDGETTEAPSGDQSISVAIVGNPQMEDIRDLTPDLFTAETGITVNYTVLEEQTLREIVTRDVGAEGDQFDAVMIGPFEAPQFGANGWLRDLNEFTANDPDYDVDDLIPSVRNALSNEGSLYAVPFYGESSFVMYRQDLLDAAGLEMPAAPTWDEVAEIARALNTDDVAGICLRGKPGWGDLGASLTTVVNTFGGTWWEANADGTPGAAQVDQPEFKEAVDFYVNLLNDAGQPDAANASFNECLALYQEGKVAMWYDATVAAGILEADDSPVKGQNGYALAPTKETDASGWLWSWALAIPENAANPDAAWEYLSFATGKDYIATAGERLSGGFAVIPPGSRQSTYELEGYQEAAAAFADITLEAMLAAPIDNPGTTPRPGLPGVQYVGIPEFQDVGTRCTQEISSVIAGGQSVDDALAACQRIATQAVS